MTPTLAELALLAAVDRDDPHVCRLAPRCAACGGCCDCCWHAPIRVYVCSGAWRAVEGDAHED